ncbi:MAG: SpoIIE family protein phosphatase [Candidatus Gastranaerophilales bacterium]|nr:SpoIIE family protein phosphatase [Candidatus Gastranaerophilales bacterium]
MLRTLKAKIILITLATLLVLSVLVLLLASNVYNNNKHERAQMCDIAVAYFSEQVNKSIGQLQENAKDLALMGKILYKSDKNNQDLLDFLVKKNFENNNLAVGGGVWFEPYKINPSKERVCAYAFHNDKEVVVDPSFAAEQYNYFTQMWYTSIKKEIQDGLDVSWTPPYFDQTGTHALMTTIGAGIFDNDNNLIGMSTVDWKLDNIIKKVSELKPTPNSFALFADKDSGFILALTAKNEEGNFVGKSLTDITWYSPELETGDTFKYNRIDYMTFVKILDNDMLLVVNVPLSELYGDITHHLKLMLALILFTIFIIVLIIYVILTKNVNKPIDYLVKTAEQIGNGDLEVQMKIDEPQEFAELASSFNKMTKDIKEYITNLNNITAEQKRIESELNIAKSIQNSVLPSVFPPYPSRTEFAIFASMQTAKEVGGDFYDFFFIDSDHFAFLIADVSGKGIPAALFMMNTKTLLKNIAKSGLSLDEVMTRVNNKIFKTNEQGFFVTIFLCVLELSTGKLSYVNAGHNPPLIKRVNGKFEYLKPEANLVAGAMNDFQYKSGEDKLNSGDFIFLYTDGITEAMNTAQEFYGEQRLLNTLNKTEEINVENILAEVKSDVESFADDEVQTDDITMLAFEYKGARAVNMKEIKEKSFNGVKTFLLPADIAKFKNVLEWVEAMCEDADVPHYHRTKLNVAIEEIFVNISTYAYPPKEGDVEISFKINKGNEIEVTFTDSGTPYNPLEQAPPDITLSAEERPVGGLGIFIVKNSMDFMGYEFKDRQNILTIKLKFTDEN